MSIASVVSELTNIAATPGKQLDQFVAQGKKVVGCMPYYVPDEIVYAGGLVPFGLWGSNTKNISRAKEYCASFYCPLAQLDLEMLLDGTCDKLSGVITPTICDTLRPMSQNIKVAMAQKMKVIFLAHPQNRRPEYGITFTTYQYTNIKKAIEELRGAEITNDELNEAIRVYNRSRKALRKFVKLASEHCDTISAVQRAAVLKARYFMLRDAYTEKLEELNAELEKLPAAKWSGVKIVTSGIIVDNPNLLKLLDENKIAIACDDVAHESRSFRVDAQEGTDDAIRALAMQFAAQDYDVLLYDEASSSNRRGEHVVDLAHESGAQGVVIFMQQFCDPEEMEYPSLKKALDGAQVPMLKIGVDMQMRDFGQASTALQAFADVLSMQ